MNDDDLEDLESVQAERLADMARDDRAERWE